MIYVFDSFYLVYFDSVEFQVKALDWLQPLAGLHIFGISGHSDVHRDLEVILLLTHERIVGQREVETFICVHSVGRHGTGEKETHSD